MDKPKKKIRLPVFFDVVLAAGLLLAMAGFTVGMLRMYVMHTARESMTQRHYKAAIALLRDSPIFSSMLLGNAQVEEMLGQSLYLDAIEKMEVSKDVQGALKELSEIKPGNPYYQLAQEIISDSAAPPSKALPQRSDR